MTEKEWIAYLKKHLFEKPPVFKTYNEDCTVIQKEEHEFLLITTDALVETIHFKLDYYSFFDLGVKLANSNLSDIAACGGEPEWALLTLGSPIPVDVNWAEPFLQGLNQSLNKFGAFLVGGDTVKSPFFFFNLTLFGKTNFPILRKGAKEGDLIFVSRPLGGSSAFLRMVKTSPLKGIPENLKKAHLCPEPEIILGKELSSKNLATSAIDISDGLLLDLWRICEENSVGAELLQEAIPIKPGATLEDALSGGEDYALLFTVSPSNLHQIGEIETKLKRKFFCIGKILPEKDLYLVSKKKERLKLKPKGFDHFNFK